MLKGKGVRPLLLTGVLSIAFSSAVLGGAVWYRKNQPTPPVAPIAVAKPKSPQAQPPAPSPLLDPTPSPGAAPIKPKGKLALQPPFTIIDGITVRSGRLTIRLADLEGPHQNSVCHDNEGGLWACGLRARVALNNLISGQTLECNTTGQEGDTILAHCSHDSTDIGRELVRAGSARPLLEKHATYGPELQAAKETRAGLWETGWRIRVQKMTAPTKVPDSKR
jgi:endonuclease YncB( thermonuclease family)